VSSAAALVGMTSSFFGAAQQAAFVTTLAATLFVDASDVSITRVADALSASSARHNRALHVVVDAPPPTAAAAHVAFEITTTAAPTALMNGVTVLSGDAASFAASLQAAGLSGLTGVSVSPPSLSVRAPMVPQNFTSAAAQSDYLAAVVSDVSAIVAAANASSTTQAVSLAAAAADALNGVTSQLNASAAAELRAALLAAIADAAGNASTPQQLQSTADAVARLVANPSQVNAASMNASLSMLQAVSAATVNRGVPITNGTAFAVAAGLSSIVAAVALQAEDGSGGGGSSGSIVLQQCLAVVSNLAASQLANLSVGAQLVVLSPAVQMRVAVDAAANASAPLFTQGVSTPGAPSAFAPLPTSLFTAAGADVSSGVRTVFAALSFDPYAGTAGNTSGITRLAFSLPSGTPLEIGNLSSPVYFTLPPPANLTAGGVKAACQFYDTAASAYSTRGCAGIPSPAPAGPQHNLSWAAGYVAASDADMAAAWTINGPLVAGCTAQVLDCSAPSPPAIFTDPANPFGAPAVRCAPGSTAPMLVFTGAACALTHADNAADCAWSNQRQAFTGAGCVAPAGAPVRCACRHVRGPALRVLNPAAVLTAGTPLRPHS
jgi:hypothetical protein